MEVKDLKLLHIDVIYELSCFRHLQITTAATENLKQSKPNTSAVEAQSFFYKLITGKDFLTMSVELKEKILDRFNSLMRVSECMELRIE